MGFGDFTPASSGRKKPISKQELKKLQANFAKADEIAKEAREREKNEKEKADKELDDLLGEMM